VAVAALLLVAAAACSPTVSPTPTRPTPTATAHASASAPSSAVADCGPSDLSMTAGPWGGAAGSRGADVTVTDVGPACRLPIHPVVAISDATGKQYIYSELPLRGDGPVIEAGSTEDFSFEVSNWCDTTARLPLQAVGLVADGPIEIAGLVMTADGLPPCNGPGQPAVISTTDWD
jgi:hypothetical protein